MGQGLAISVTLMVLAGIFALLPHGAQGALMPVIMGALGLVALCYLIAATRPE